MPSLHFRFKNKAAYESVMFETQNISLFDLKKEIATSQNMLTGGELELKIVNNASGIGNSFMIHLYKNDNIILIY